MLLIFQNTFPFFGSKINCKLATMASFFRFFANFLVFNLEFQIIIMISYYSNWKIRNWKTLKCWGDDVTRQWEIENERSEKSEKVKK